MDRNFQRALSLVLKHEGGWADHPKDPGGATMRGVTLATFRRYVKPNATKDDLRKITDEQLAMVYRRYYWDAVAGAELPDGIDYAVFDFAVNSGPARAAKYLQAIVGTKQDGKIGPATLAATRAMFHAEVIHKLCDSRMAYLKRAKGSSGALKGKLLWPTFGKGWASRVTDVRRQALELAARPTPERPSIIEKEVDKPVVPSSVDQEVKQKTGLWSWITGLSSSGALGFGWLVGMDWQAIVAIGGVVLAFLVVIFLMRRQIIAGVKEIREGLA